MFKITILSNRVYFQLLLIMVLNIVTWNVRGSMSSAVPLSHILDKHSVDIALICEHKLLPQSISFLESIHPEYSYIATCDASINPYKNVKCGKAGTAILYKKKLCQIVSRLDIQNERISGIEVKAPHSTPIYVFCVYMPSDTNVDYYKKYFE